MNDATRLLLKIVRMRIAGKRFKEIAAETGISESYVAVLITRARKAGIDIPKVAKLRLAGFNFEEVKSIIEGKQSE